MFSRGLGRTAKDMQRQLTMACKTGKALNDNGRSTQAQSVWQMGMKAAKQLAEVDVNKLPKREFLQLIGLQAEVAVSQGEQDTALSVMEVGASIIVPHGSSTQVCVILPACRVMMGTVPRRRARVSLMLNWQTSA